MLPTSPQEGLLNADDHAGLFRGPEVDTLLHRLKSLDLSLYTPDYLHHQHMQHKSKVIIDDNDFAQRYLKLGANEDFIIISLVEDDQDVVTFTTSSLQGVARFEVCQQSPHEIKVGKDREDNALEVFDTARGSQDHFVKYLGEIVQGKSS